MPKRPFYWNIWTRFVPGTWYVFSGRSATRIQSVINHLTPLGLSLGFSCTLYIIDREPQMVRPKQWHAWDSWTLKGLVLRWAFWRIFSHSAGYQHSDHYEHNPSRDVTEAKNAREKSDYSAIYLIYIYIRWKRCILYTHWLEGDTVHTTQGVDDARAAMQGAVRHGRNMTSSTSTTPTRASGGSHAARIRLIP